MCHARSISGEAKSMRRISIRVIAAAFVVATAMTSVIAQNGRETYTGTVVSYGSGRNIRTTTNTFTLIINGETSDSEVNRLVGILQEGGQDRLQEAINDNDLGNFSVGGRIGPTLNAVTIDEVDGRKRIRALFERWIRFGELRWGARSVDYPFGYIELFIDPRTGKGEGTLIEAAQVRWKRNKDMGQYVVEIENFATFPAKLMGVTQRGGR